MEERKCEEHKEEQMHLCQTCIRKLCAQCLPSHVDHEICKLEEAVRSADVEAASELVGSVRLKLEDSLTQAQTLLADCTNSQRQNVDTVAAINETLKVWINSKLHEERVLEAQELSPLLDITASSRDQLIRAKGREDQLAAQVSALQQAMTGKDNEIDFETVSAIQQRLQDLLRAQDATINIEEEALSTMANRLKELKEAERQKDSQDWLDVVLHAAHVGARKTIEQEAGEREDTLAQLKKECEYNKLIYAKEEQAMQEQLRVANEESNAKARALEEQDALLQTLSEKLQATQESNNKLEADITTALKQIDVSTQNEEKLTLEKDLLNAILCLELRMNYNKDEKEFIKAVMGEVLRNPNAQSIHSGMLKDYGWGERLGTGSIGTTFIVKGRDPGRLSVGKVIRTEELALGDSIAGLQLIQACTLKLLAISHPALNQVSAVFFDSQQRSYAIISDYCEGIKKIVV